MRTLYPPIDAFDTFRLCVSNVHEIHVEQAGNPAVPRTAQRAVTLPSRRATMPGRSSIVPRQRTLDVNLTGMFLCLKRAVPMLKANGGGAIINLSSAAGKFGFPLRTPYAASKFGVIGLTETLAIELGPHQIRVNAILPGVVAGARQDRVLTEKAKARGVTLAEQRDYALSRVSMRAMVEGADIANAAVYLASDAGRFVSGERLSVGGNVEGLS